jgi:hypothetical protein
MSLHIEPLPSLPQLRGLLEVTRLVRDERDLTRLVDGIAETDLGVSGLGHGRDQPLPTRRRGLRSDGGARERRGARGPARHHAAGGCLDALPGRALPSARRLPDSRRRGRLGGHALPCPDFSISLDPNAWHPEDAWSSRCGVPTERCSALFLWTSRSLVSGPRTRSSRCSSPSPSM